MPEEESLSWYHSDLGDLPEVTALQTAQWLKVGAGASSLPDAGGVRIQAVAQSTFYRRKLFAGDGVATKPRNGDRAELQITMRGASQVPAWASGVSPLVIGLDDGLRSVAVAIGTDLWWIDPATGDKILPISASHGFTRRHVFHLIKDRSQAFLLYVDGDLVGELPYIGAADRLLVGGVSQPASAFWGSLDPGGSSDSEWNQPEVGLNVDLPPQWKVDRFRNTMPAPIQSKWNSRWRAHARAILGLFQQVDNAVNGAFELLTASRRLFEGFAFSGALLPDAEDPPWTIVSPADFSVVRQRVRISPSAAVASYAAVMFNVVRSLAEVRGAATFTVRNYTTTDPDGRVGPYIEVRTGHRLIRADLVEVGPDQVGWVLNEGTSPPGGLAQVGSTVWLVEEREAHRVEVQVLGRDRVLLLVDGGVVDDVNYNNFSVAVATRQVRIGRLGGATIAVTVDVDNAVAETRYTDLSRRPIFLQGVAERLVFTGGCERNDHLDTLVRSHHELQEIRGTTVGILLEMRRLSCSDLTDIVTETEQGQWYLELTYPEITPIFIEAEGVFTTATIEFRAGAPLFRPQELADLAATYLVPVSLLELSYEIAVATDLLSAAVAGVSVSFVVSDTLGFEVGQVVTFRDAANTVHVTATASTVDPITDTITVDALSLTFPIGSILRIVLATT